MAPFVPDVISDQLNLIVALLVGIGFGFVLEQAGFSSSRRLAGVFYGYDFTVLRVFFTAAVTAMSGVLLLGYFGLLDTDAIFVNPTWLIPAIVGGVIMGAGFIIGGYCPGTSVCAAAIGKIDAMFFVGGGVLGVFGFAELYPFYKHFNDSTSLGPIKVFDSLGISQGLFAFILMSVAVGAFYITTIIEKRVNTSSAPAFAFIPSRHIAAGISVLALGIVFLFMPNRKEHLINKVSDAQYMIAHPVATMEVDELAFRIVDREPNIQIIDIRQPDAFAKLALPGSFNVQMQEFFSKDMIEMLSRRHVKKVILGESEAGEHVACLLLQELGYENIVTLKGGFVAFNQTIVSTPPFIPTGSRWDPDVKQFRQTAHAQILTMIESEKNKTPKIPKQEKKIQGGC